MDAFTAELNELFVTTYHSICKVEEAMLRSLSNSKLTIAEMHMLEAIGKRRSQGRTITDLAQDQEISLPSVTMTIKRLEKKGYVCKDKSAEDGRCVRVKLTREGERAEIAHRYFHRQMVRAVAGAMD